MLDISMVVLKHCFIILLTGLFAFTLINTTALAFLSNSKETRSIVIKNSRVSIDSLISQVRSLNHQKKYHEAISVLRAAIDISEEDLLLKALLMQTFDLFIESEIISGQKKIASNKRDISSYMAVAGSFDLLDEDLRAMEVLLNGIKYNHNSSKLWMFIARLELKAGRKNEALDVFKNIYRIDSKNSDALNNAAYLLVQANYAQKDLVKAQKLVTNARKIDPKNTAYMNTLAEINFKKGNSHEAIKLIRDAIKLDPSNEKLKTNLKVFSTERHHYWLRAQ